MGELDVGRIAGDNDDLFAEPFDQSGIVGRTQIILGVGAKEEFALKDLRRLDRHRVGTLDRPTDHKHRRIGISAQDRGDLIDAAVVFDGFGVDALERVAYWYTGNHGGVIGSGVEDAVDQFVSRCGPSCIVDGDMGASFIDEIKCGFDGLPAMALPALDEFGAEQREAISVLGFEGSECVVVVWAGDDDLADIIAGVEEFDGALEDGFSPEVFVELGPGLAEHIERICIALIESC